MKRILSVIAIVGTAFWLNAPSVFAATASAGPFPTSATVDGTLSMTATLHKNSSTGPTVTSMDFGTLKDTGTGTLRSDVTGSTGTGNVTAILTANSHGLPYTISETGTAMSNGTNSLPAGALTFVPVYAAADNGGAAMPTGAALGTKGTWVSATAKPIYTSESGTAAMRTVQAVYSITDDPSAGATTGVPLNQPGGTYSGTVTFTVTA